MTPRRGVRGFTVLGFLALLAGCAGTPVRTDGGGGTAGNRVLGVGRQMVDRREIIQGGCWDYINAVYKRAGYPEGRRETVFKSRKPGPYAKHDMIRPGDWLHFINHSYGDIEHSGIFVSWTNRGRRIARMLSYGGEKRREPGRYLDYDLTHVYGIIRPAP